MAKKPGETSTGTGFEMTPVPTHHTASAISIVEDEIVVLGPGAIAFSMTRAAAEETYRRLGAVLGLTDPPLRSSG
jgi:hypothetical protein